MEEFRRCAELLHDEFLTSQLEDMDESVNEFDRKQGAIASADVFQLYWSRQALNSHQMEREWRYAVSLNRADFIRPLYWEEPFPTDPQRSLPPSELLRLGFQKIPSQVAVVRHSALRLEDDTPSSKIEILNSELEFLLSAPPPKMLERPETSVQRKLERSRKPRVSISPPRNEDSDKPRAVEPPPRSNSSYQEDARHPRHAGKKSWLVWIPAAIILAVCLMWLMRNSLFR